jgi:hypothetical protein
VHSSGHQVTALPLPGLSFFHKRNEAFFPRKKYPNLLVA